MFSNPNSYLGGNSLRPGTQQYGNSFGMGAGQQPQQQQPQQQQQQQPSPFAPQPTGFGQAPLQQQYTGYPGLQPQATGIPPQMTGMPQQPTGIQQQPTGMPQQRFGQPQQQQSFQTGAPPMPAIPQQYQQQIQQQQQQQQQPGPSPFASAASQPPAQTSIAPPPAPVQKPQPTGFHEMAASFQTGNTAKPQARPAEKSAVKIPNIRLGFITAQDQAKFETLFKSAVGDGQTTMSGEKARDLLMRSRLDGDSLSHVWYVGLPLLIDHLSVLCANYVTAGLSPTRPDPASFTSPNLRSPCIFAI